jgi:hypothetical protein
MLTIAFSSAAANKNYYALLRLGFMINANFIYSARRSVTAAGGVVSVIGGSVHD